MQSTIEHLKLKVSEASEAAMRGMKAAMKAVGMNDPDRGPGDYASEDDERVMIPVRMFEQMMRRSGGHGHGSVSSNSRILTVLVAINTALLIGVGGWLLVTVAQHDKDIAVIKCQIDPQCREALARVRP
jgi:hypothetical protein